MALKRSKPQKSYGLQYPRIFKRPAADDTITVVQWEDKTWGELKDQPDIYQVLKTNIKLTVQLQDDILEELQAGHTISTALVCETLDGRDYVFQNGIEMQKIQLRKNIVFIKVLINPISKLKKEADSFCQLPLYPQDRKAKARFWLRFYCARYRPIDTDKFFLFIRRDELRSYKIEEGLPTDDMPETPRRELKKSTDSLRESSNSVQPSQPTTTEDDKSQTSEPKSPTSTPQSNSLRRSMGAKNKSLSKSRTPQTPQTPQARTTMWTPRTVLVPPNTTSDPATSGSATPKLMARPNFASATHLGGAFKPLTASAPGTLFPGHLGHSIVPIDDQHPINYSSHVITVTHSSEASNSSQSTSLVPPNSSANNVNISPRPYSVSPTPTATATTTDTAPAARMYPASLRASSPGLRAPTATVASPLVGRRALTSSGAMIEMPPVFTNSNDRRNSSPIVFTPIQTISQPTSIDNTNPQHTTATYSLMVQQQIAEIEQQLITHQQQLRECQDTVDKITSGDFSVLVNITNATTANNSAAQTSTSEAGANSANVTSSDAAENEPMIECSDVDDAEMTDATEQQTSDANTTSNETEAALPFPTVAVCKYNIYTDYSFVGEQLAAYNERFLLFVDEEIYASLPIADIWGSQRVLSGNPMSLEALKNNQERLMAKQDMPLICFVWLQGKRTDGSLFKVERCAKCQQNEVGKDFPVNPLRVYGTDLIRVHESKLSLRCKVIESSHHLEGSMFRVCIQLFDRAEQNGVSSLLQVTQQPLTSEWQRCIFSRTPKPVKEKELPKQPPPAQISEENLLLFSLMQKKAQQIQEITGLSATLTQLKRQRESMQSNLLLLHQRPDAVQICTQVLKPHLSVRMNKEFLPALTSGTGTLDIELIWSFQTEKFNYWKTIVIPNGLFYETTKPFFAESDVIKFKHVHLSNWTSIKNYIRDYLPKVYWKDKYLKANYGIRFNARVNNQITAYLEAPCLFSIDIRRENDPGYSKKKISRDKLNKSMDFNSQSAAGEDQESEPLSQ